MSEQLANLYSATVQGGGYVAGSGTLVASAAVSGTQPTLGTFSITILDSSGNVLLIFRVASVSGSTFTGAAEGPDTNAPAGSLIVGTMLTVDSINQLFADHSGGGGFIQPVTVPVAGDFSDVNFNTGTGVVTTRSNNTSSISLLQVDPNNTQQIVALQKAKLASTFTIRIAISVSYFPIGNNTAPQGLAGIWISDGGSPPNNIFWCIQGANEGFRIPLFTDLAGTFGGDVLPQGVINIEPLPMGPLLWFEIQETASARIYSLGDGSLFFPVFSESNTAHFTTADYGWGCTNRSQPGSILATNYSFTETNP
jgi:hypothetical protein